MWAEQPPRPMRRSRRRWLAAALLLGGAAGWPLGAHAIGLPPAYEAIVVEPSVNEERSQFDLRPAVARARAEGKRLYMYLGARECPFCRRYEAFLDRHATELRPHFKPWLLVDLRSSLRVNADRLWLQLGDRALPFAEFQKQLGDERQRLVYPSVWLLNPTTGKPLMQMPAGTGTFETVEEQVEVLNLVQ